MLSFSKSDLSNGAQEKVVAASDFQGPRPRGHRAMTDSGCLPIMFLGLLFTGYCTIAPHVAGKPGYYKLTYGTSYAGTCVWSSLVTVISSSDHSVVLPCMHGVIISQPSH